MDTILFQYLDLDNEEHKNILDMIQKGLVQWAISDDTGGIILSLTDEGKQTAEDLERLGEW